MSSALAVPNGPLAKHHPVGASTGYMAEHREDWPRLVEEAEGVSPFAVELSAMSEAEFDPLVEYLATAPVLPFRYLSVHAPSKHRRRPESDFVEQLMGLPHWVDAIVVHPDEMKDPTLYAACGSRLVLENMDVRKQTGRTASELEQLFDVLPEAGLCFDIAHAWSVANDMSVATRLLDAFKARLRHVHVSSVTGDCDHEPLRAEHEALFAPLLARCSDVPWILEAPLRAS